MMVSNSVVVFQPVLLLCFFAGYIRSAQSLNHLGFARLCHLGMCKPSLRKRFGERWKFVVSWLEKESLLRRFGGCTALKLKNFSRVQEEVHFTWCCELSALFAVHPKSLKWKILARA